MASRFVRFLDILEEALSRSAGLIGRTPLETTTFSGSLDTDDRIENIRLFNISTSGPVVLFLSVSAGGTGLNIATASRLIICEPQYSPGSIKQLKGRLHRLPQRRVVHVYNVVGQPCPVDRYLVDIVAEKSHTERSIMAGFQRYDHDPLDLPPLERPGLDESEGEGDVSRDEGEAMAEW